MSEEKKILGFSKNVFFLGIVSFLTDVSSEMIYPLLPIFLTSILHTSISFLGIIEGVAESTASILKFFSGAISDKINKRKPIIVLGYTLSSITRPLIALAYYPYQVLFIRFFDRIGKGVRTSPRDALIADSCNTYERGKSFGFHRAMDHAGAVIGPLFAFTLLFFFPAEYRLVFGIAFIPAILSIFFVTIKIKEKKQVQTTQNKFNFNLKILTKKFKIFLLIIFIFTLGNSSDAFLIIRAKDLGVKITYIPILWILLHLVKMIFSVPGGMLSDKIGRIKIITLGWIIYFITYLGFAYANTQFHIWLLFGIYGTFFGLTEGAEKALVADITDCEVRGFSYGIYNFVIGIGALPSSVIFGLIWQYLGVKTAFIYGAILALTASLLILILFRNFDKKCEVKI